MLRGMTTRQFQEWRAYADLEPFDEERADLRAAHIVQTLLNLHRKKGAQPFQLKDCVLRFSPVEASRPSSPEQARAEVRKTMDLLMLIYNAPAGAPKPARARRGQ
jgi:hypothetical protein